MVTNDQSERIQSADSFSCFKSSQKNMPPNKFPLVFPLDTSKHISNGLLSMQAPTLTSLSLSPNDPLGAQVAASHSGGQNKT
jgi:hypothetical protein